MPPLDAADASDTIDTEPKYRSLVIEMVLQHFTMQLIMGNLIFANTLSGISLIKTQELLMVIHHFIVLQNKEILMYANSF